MENRKRGNRLMPYYCLECKKTHANGYKKHLKYKSAVLVSKKKGPDLFSKIEDDFTRREKAFLFAKDFLEKENKQNEGQDEIQKKIEKKHLKHIIKA